MAASLLGTKLHIPSPRRALVARPRLLVWLLEGPTRPLTLALAPAGSGKTTLLSEWRAPEGGRAFPIAWLSLDEDDNDFAGFWIDLLAALRKVTGEAVDAAQSLLLAPQSPPPKTLVAALAGSLAYLPAPFAPVLDNYHVISVSRGG